jgi:hypothetical protein
MQYHSGSTAPPSPSAYVTPVEKPVELISTTAFASLEPA